MSPTRLSHPRPVDWDDRDMVQEPTGDVPALPAIVVTVLAITTLAALVAVVLIGA